MEGARSTNEFSLSSPLSVEIMMHNIYIMLDGVILLYSVRALLNSQSVSSHFEISSISFLKMAAQELIQHSYLGRVLLILQLSMEMQACITCIQLRRMDLEGPLELPLVIFKK
jgi:hypothetical protein